MRSVLGLIGLTLGSLVLLLVTVSACKRSEPSLPNAERKLVVFAAASLAEPFRELGGVFERAHPGVEVVFNFAGTQELAIQLKYGAVVDVFASADRFRMDELVQTGRVNGPVVIAQNEPVLVVARDQRARIREFAELPSVERIVIGAPEVPIGRYTLQILDRASHMFGKDFRARVEEKVVSRELNVRQVLAKVRLGEADAAIVYRSDALAAAKDVGVLHIPPKINVIAEYPMAAISGAPEPLLAQAWVQLVLSTVGQKALARAGFMAASSGSPTP